MPRCHETRKQILSEIIHSYRPQFKTGTHRCWGDYCNAAPCETAGSIRLACVSYEFIYCYAWQTAIISLEIQFRNLIIIIVFSLPSVGDSFALNSVFAAYVRFARTFMHQSRSYDGLMALHVTRSGGSVVGGENDNVNVEGRIKAIRRMWKSKLNFTIFQPHCRCWSFVGMWPE